MPAVEPDISRLLPALVHIQTHLDEDLSLEVLAGRVHLSPAHFHRRFKAAVGETSRTYVERLRLERAAFLLGFEDRSVLELALDVGYPRPETFTRAFRRRFGMPPRAWRRQWRAARPAPVTRSRGGLERHTDGGVSPTRLRRVKPMHVAFIRHVGPYESVPPSLFDELLEWATRTGRDGAALMLGLGHDAPGVTAPDQLRFDACLRVAEPFRAAGRIGHQVVPGGLMATTVHVGPFDTLSAAWGVAWTRAMGFEGLRPAGLPVMEIYDAVHIDPDRTLNQTELCLWLAPHPT